MIKYYYKEGQTPIDEDEKLALIPYLTSFNDLNAWEQENIIDARKWVLQTSVLSRNDLFETKFLLKLHEKMFNKTWKWAGKIRNSNKNIGCDYLEIYVELKKLNDDAKFWIDNSIYKIKELALVYHHRLVKIHLFPNGNGRHARLVADAIIKKFGLEDKIDWQGKNYQSLDDLRKKYVNSLKKADSGNYQELFDLFL